MTAEPEKNTSGTYKTIRALYYLFAGTPLARRIFHFKYLTTYQIHPDIKLALSTRGGDIIDFGCGTKPYMSWLKNISSYVGVDMYKHDAVDVLVQDGMIPLEDNRFDLAIATQVFEHTESLSYLQDLYRIVKEGGELVISVPFLYHIHENHDHRRFTKQGLQHELEQAGFVIDYIKSEGGVGSTTGILFLYFVDALIRDHVSRFWLIILSPIILFWYVLMVPLINCFGVLLDKADVTDRFYNNIIAIAHKPSNS